MCVSKKFGAAALALGINRRVVKHNFLQAIRYFHEGVEFGSRDAAISLQQFFEDGYWDHVEDLSTHL
jgi:hypothetical protein